MAYYIFFTSSIFLLFLIAVEDASEYYIRNSFLLFLLPCLYCVYGFNFCWIGGVVIVLFSILANLNVMGWGDVKLLSCLGLTLEEGNLISILLLSSFIGGISAIIKLSAHKKGSQENLVPYGAFLAVSSIIILGLEALMPTLSEQIQSLFQSS